MPATEKIQDLPEEKKTVQVTFNPMGLTYEVPYEETLFEAALDAGVDVDTVCGGNGSCGKCKVRFLSSPPDTCPLDHVHLSGGEIQDGYRISCQVSAREDIVVEVPPAGDKAGVQILHEGVKREVELRPNVLKIFIPYTEPDERDGLADWDHIKGTLPRWFQSVTVPLHWMRQLPDFIRREGGMTVVVAAREVIRFEGGNTTAHHYGAAFDIGSTTVVGFLVDLNTGEEVAAASGLNTQVKYGDDLISRLARVQFSPENLERMHNLIIEQINGILDRLASEANIDTEQINEVTMVGNMAMHHFLLRLDSTHLGLAPYAPVFRQSTTVSAREIGLILEPDTPIYILPNIAGFVGSDTVGVMLASQMPSSDGILMAVDVGTNGEIALGWKKWLIACSAPAGPAFEGARIKQGMRAAKGAIDHVIINGGNVEFSVIGDAVPKGICGSALIDITAELLRCGLVDWGGKLYMEDEIPASVPEHLRKRIVDGKNRGDTHFVVAWAEETGGEHDVYLTQADIREFQLAKGAIRAGEMVLQHSMGLEDDDLDEVLLAGAFGNFMKLENAREVNLLPPIAMDRLRSVGNAAGVGSRLALVSIKERIGAERIARKTEHIQLSGLPEFQSAFIDAMRFPLYKDKS